MFTCGSIVVGGGEGLTLELAQRIVPLLRGAPEDSERVLGGRRSVTHATIEGVGSIVVKHYTRGGIFGRLVRERYIRCGRVRSAVEYSALHAVRACGVRAPKPIAYAFEQGLVYRAWLITEEIPGAVSLAELALRDDPRTAELTQEAMRQIQILVGKGWRHIDLHAGNVLVDTHGAVWIIDFDKASLSGESHRSLRDYYLCRWRRAVIKHDLPDVLAEVASMRLRERVPEEVPAS